MGAAVFTAASLVLVSCGNAGSPLPGLIKGDEAADQLADSLTEAILLCQVRTSQAVNIPLKPLLKIQIEQYYSIDTGRMYRQSDVDTCKQGVTIGLALNPQCNFFSQVCKLNAVNKITGGN